MSRSLARSVWIAMALTVALGASLVSTAVAGTIPTFSSKATYFGMQRKIVKASTGTLALLYQKGSTSPGPRGLVVARSTDRGATWTDLFQLSSSTSTFGDAFIALDDNIYITYSRDSGGASNSNDVWFVKLTYNAAGDTWTAGAPVKVFDGVSLVSGSAYAVIGGDGINLFVAFRYFDGTTYSLMVRSSANDGLTWVDSIQAEAPNANSITDAAMLVPVGSRLALVYYSQKTDIRVRWRDASDAPTAWDPAEIVYVTPGGLAARDGFSAVADFAGRLHLVFAHGGIKHIAHDGVAWGPVTTLSATGALPTLASNGVDLWAVWYKKISSTVSHILAMRTTGNPQVWDPTVETLSETTNWNSHPVGLIFDVVGPVIAWRKGASSPYSVVTLAKDAPPSVNLPPRATVSATPLLGVAPELVTFTSIASDPDGTVTGYSWDFGDGSAPVTTPGAAHTYALPGTYPATLTVTDDDGDTATASLTITILPNTPPVVSVGATPTYGYRPVPVQFSATAADVDPLGSIVSTWWDFGDGSGAAGLAPLHTYATPVASTTVYTATFTATDNKGATTSATVDITVEPNEGPVVSITATPTMGPVGLVVTFTSAAFDPDPDGSISSYLWTFGDGGTSTEAAPTYTYSTAGTFTATLTVLDNHGAPGSASIVIRTSSLSSTTRLATSFQNMRKIVRASSGTLAMIYQKGTPVSEGNGLRLAISRDNGDTWTDSIEVGPNGSVYADVMIDPVTNDIDLVYSQNADGLSYKFDVYYIKLDYLPATDTWKLLTKTFVYDSLTNNTGAFNAVITRDASYLWAAYRYHTAGNFRIVIAYSADGGLTWTAALDADAGGANADESAAFVRFGNKIGLLYLSQDSELRWRTHTDGDPVDVWTPPVTVVNLATGLESSKSAYSLVVDNAGIVHLLYPEEGMRHLMFDGTSWSGSGTSFYPTGAHPTLSTDGTDLWAIFEVLQPSGQRRIAAMHYTGGVWGPTLEYISDLMDNNGFATSIHSDAGGPIVAWTHGVNPVAVIVRRVGPIPAP